MKKFSYNANHPRLLKNALPVKNQEVMSFIKKIDTNNFFFKSTLDLKKKLFESVFCINDKTSGFFIGNAFFNSLG